MLYYKQAGQRLTYHIGAHTMNNATRKTLAAYTDRLAALNAQMDDIRSQYETLKD